MAHGSVWFLAGVVVGAAAAIVVAQQAAATSPPAPQADSTERFGRAFEDAMTRALRRVQSEGAAARAGEASPSESGGPQLDARSPRASRRSSAQRTPPESPRADEASAVGADGAMTRDAATPLHEKNAARLEQLVVTTKEAKAKRRVEWMFLSEAALAGELGLPDAVDSEDKGAETWRYEIPFTNADNEQDSKQIAFVLRRGRVIDISGLEEIPEQR